MINNAQATEDTLSAGSAISQLLDHLTEHDRRASQNQYHTTIEPRLGRDGWFIATVHDWQRYSVFLKREGALLLYQCTCPTFAAQAPLPCMHIAQAAVAAVQNGVLTGDGVMTAKIKGYGESSIKPILPKRPVAGISNDGAIQLVMQLGKPVTNAKSLALPWKPYFQQMRSFARPVVEQVRWPVDRQILYVLDVAYTVKTGSFTLDTMYREPKQNGKWRKATPLSLTPQMLAAMPEGPDRELALRLVGTAPVQRYGGYEESGARRTLSSVHLPSILPMLCATGRLFLRRPNEKDFWPQPVQWDGPTPWQLVIDIARDESIRSFRLTGHLERDGQIMPLRTPTLLLANGYVFVDDRVAPLNDFGAFEWIAMLRDRKEIRVPFTAEAELLAELYNVPRLPRLNLPDELKVEQISAPMKPRLRISPGKKTYWDTDPKLFGKLEFEYGGKTVSGNDVGTGILQLSERRVINRDPVAEEAARQKLKALGFVEEYNHEERAVVLRLAQRRLPDAIRELTRDGWHIEAEGKLYRRPGEFKLDVTSGIDWFDLTAQIDFDGQTASLPALLAALRKGENVVRLGDGTFGILPEEWLKKYGGLAEVGTVQDDTVRFTRTQVGLLDALLASQPEATFDEAFRRTRDELRSFSGVNAIDPPPTFIGELRPYQCEGLGWFDFLRRFGFGGCLADDMGLGKTVQVLALLEARRTEAPEKRRPALVVVPRSLIFNWKQEAAKFTPNLRVVDHSMPDRTKESQPLLDHDLVLTTYGTLRRDVSYLRDIEFDYIVIDEAQAVKNSNSESAKAVRLLRGQHRLALTGTPVQNHLGDLWSLFDFLNPGMLGAVSAFSNTGSLLKNPDQESRTMLSRGLRPFILRRTKEQVAKELPAKMEQTLYCELEPEQRKLYNELREHYRRNLLAKVAEGGIGKAKIQILEALLRLRQAACHPGLIDKTRTDQPSAKLDLLMPKLTEAHEEGHKVLVFSQFTSFLTLLKHRLVAEKIDFEYLDGKTRDRQAKVDHFQTDPNCKLFLISLKAGGVGLNLTAADYVFLLDPWWNPAIEAQAIDRTHRIGQTRQVFACRLIAKDTVEEKVLALQQSKRELADAIINADNSLIRTLGREDLEILLS